MLIGILDSVRELLEPELLSLLELELRLGMLDLRGSPDPCLEVGAWARRQGRELSTGDTDLKLGDISQCGDSELGDEHMSSIVQCTVSQEIRPSS